jgi:hypothetical protein
LKKILSLVSRFCYFGRVLLHDEERELWATVLACALDDLAKSKSIARVAHTWIFSSNNAVGSFIWICQHLDLDFSYIRRGVMQRISKAA